jgi:hypothetical protein
VIPNEIKTTVITKKTASSIGNVLMRIPVDWVGSIVQVPEPMAIASIADK